MNNELEKMRKEMVVVTVKTFSGHLPGGTEVNHKHCPVIIIGIPEEFEPRISRIHIRSVIV